MEFTFWVKIRRDRTKYLDAKNANGFLKGKKDTKTPVLTKF